MVRGEGGGEGIGEKLRSAGRYGGRQGKMGKEKEEGRKGRTVTFWEGVRWLWGVSR